MPAPPVPVLPPLVPAVPPVVPALPGEPVPALPGDPVPAVPVVLRVGAPQPPAATNKSPDGNDARCSKRTKVRHG